MQPDLRTGFIALFVLLFLGSVRTDEKNGKWWHDNLAGPDSSNYVDLDQIKKSNVDDMEVAWTYPYAAGGFNPIVVDDTVYVSGRNGSLIALDASTGKEIWIHEGLNGMTSRGINYWQSDDGKERRLLFSINNFLQAIDARTGLSIPTFGLDGNVDLRARAPRGEKMGWNNNSPGKVWKNLLILGSTTGRSLHLSARGHPRIRRGHRQEDLAVPYCPAARESSATTPGRRMPTSTLAAPTTGARCRSTTSAESCTCRPDRRPTTSMGRTASARTCLRIACLRSTRARESGCGTSRRSITTSGTTTTCRRRSW